MLATPIEVKKAYKEGTHKKKYRFVVLNDDGTEDFTIDNDTLVAESVHIDERMATGSELKFGLCEGSSLEFQYFDHPNINGKRIHASIGIYYDDVHVHYTSMGYFTVKECPRQFSTGIYKATCYNQLQSDYLDAPANDLLIDAYNNQDTYSPSNIEKLLNIALADYKIDVHTKLSTSTYNDISSQKVSLAGTSKTIDLKVYKTVGQIAETHYLHAICPYFRIRFTTSSNMYKIAKFDASYINDQVMNRAGAPGDVYGEYKVDSNDQGFYTWLSTPGSNIADIRGGVYQYNYTDANNTVYYVSDYIRNADNNIPTPYYWDINSNTTSYGSVYYFGFYFPMYWVLDDNPTYDWTSISDVTFNSIRSAAQTIVAHFVAATGNFEVWKQKTSVASSMAVGPEIVDWPNVTLRELQSAVYEMQCQYGQLNRESDEFSGVELNGGGLYPAETLYPANTLYPNSNTGGQGIHPYPSEYSQLWTDTMGEQSFRYLYVTYKTLDENNQEVDAVLQRTVNADGTTDYNMSDNWLFRNFVWTAADVGDYADAMVLKMQNIRWFPFEMWAAGLPYVETGDAIEITDREGNTHNSYILQRQLQGIQNLQDTYVNGELDIF